MSKLKNKRLFIDPSTYSMIGLLVPTGTYMHAEYEVTMRDCSRQTHWCFSADRKGLAKAKKVAKFFNELQAELEQVVKEKKK